MGMKQKELADKLQITVQFMSLVEAGTRSLGEDNLVKISAIFGINPSALKSSQTEQQP